MSLYREPRTGTQGIGNWASRVTLLSTWATSITPFKSLKNGSMPSYTSSDSLSRKNIIFSASRVHVPKNWVHRALGNRTYSKGFWVSI